MALVALNLTLTSGESLKVKAMSLFTEASGQAVLAVSAEVGRKNRRCGEDRRRRQQGL